MNSKKHLMGKISYINASPVFYGLDHGLLPQWLEMFSDVPSVLNHKIKTGQIIVSPISAAFYGMNHKDLLVLPDLSISCNGEVLSVLLASNYRIEDLDGKKVLFSKESASAAAFLKMIFSRKNVFPEFEVTLINEIKNIPSSADAVLVIGDFALTQPWSNVFEHIFDLGKLWHEMTGLPFVFAVWAVNRDFSKKEPEVVKDIHNLLLESKNAGYENIEKIIEAGANKLKLEQSVIKEYFNLLHCDLDDKKIKGLETFFDSLFDQNILKNRTKVEFFSY